MKYTMYIETMQRRARLNPSSLHGHYKWWKIRISIRSVFILYYCCTKYKIQERVEEFIWKVLYLIAKKNPHVRAALQNWFC